MTNHSVDILTNGRWVLVGNVQRWQGEHLSTVRTQPQLGTPGTCGCGRPAYSKRARYCHDCKEAAA